MTTLPDNSANYGYTPMYTELQPLQLSPNTYDNVPVGTRSADDQSPSYVHSNNCGGLTGNQYPNYTASQIPCSQNAVVYHVQYISDSHLQQLLVLFRGLPKVMFVDNLIRMYSSCEASLDRVRNDLFELVRNMEGFPSDHVMKKRVPTKAATLTEKLANDCYTLLSVLEGAGIASPELKELLSNSRRKKGLSVSGIDSTNVQQSQSDQASCHPTMPEVYQVELKGLKDSIVSLNAEMLNLKQQYAANESARSNQIKILKETVCSLKNDMSGLANSVSKSVSDMKQCLERIDSEKALGFTRLKNEIKQINAGVKSLEDSVYMAQFPPLDTSNSKNKQKAGQNQKKNKSKSSSSQQQQQTSKSQEVNSNDTLLSDKCRDFIPPSPVVDCSNESRDDNSVDPDKTCDNDSSSEQHSDFPSGDSSSNASLTNENVKSSKTGASETVQNCDKVSSVICQVIDHNTDSGAQMSQHPIPVATSRRCNPPSNVTSVEPFLSVDDDSLDEFVEYSRKRTKRFYVKGFKPSITEDKISTYVRNRGLKVTKVTIFRYRFKPPVIRLNVEISDEVQHIENPFFWPKGVICRPWYTYNRYQQNQYGSSGHSQHPLGSWRGDNRRPHRYLADELRYNRSDVTDYNPYLVNWGSDID